MASGKPTAVHFTLIVFVMISLILGVVSYLYIKEYKETMVKLQDATKKQQTADGGLTTTLTGIESLKKLLGYENIQDVGQGGANEANTVFAALRTDLATQGADLQQNTVKATLAALRASLDTATQEIATLRKNLQDEQDRLLALRTNYEDQMSQIKNSQTGSESRLQEAVASKDEIAREKDQQISQWQADYRREQVEKETLRDEFEKSRKQSEERIALLNRQIDFLKGQLDVLTKVSFERQDGTIVNVDYSTRTVWIDLGRKDNLRPQITFSVYSRDNRGIARGKEDIKAKIEVTGIIDDHLATANIIEEDLTRPIAKGDPIYSPLYSGGRKEMFAFVGVMDLDGDKKSDWPQLKEIVEHAGAGVDLVVNDEGYREPSNAQISVNTKFLVVGDILDQSNFRGQPEKIEQIDRVQSELKALQNEARLYGVRVVNLNDFMSYIGYKPQQRLFLPGETRAWNLKAGAQSTGVDDSYSDRTSAGQTSELFRQNSRNRFQQSSEGTTSSLFKQ